jgi:hypothetical protein
MKRKRIPKKVLNLNVGGRRLRSRWKQQVNKDVTRKEDHGKKMGKSSCGKTEMP